MPLETGLRVSNCHYINYNNTDLKNEVVLIHIILYNDIVMKTPSCGCTAAIVTADTIPPGGAGEIKATFSSDSISGNINKSITVASNDPDTPNYRLTIFGEIIKDLIINPEHIDFGSVFVGEKTSKTVSIKSQTVPDFKIKKITPSKPFIDARIVGEKKRERNLII
ncbi:MAG: DUF1573 domain-containing protein [Candidatus Scalindua sp.]|nr:DUF1573 domain-containing protein [Candidatus Scalindua sp.]